MKLPDITVVVNKHYTKSQIAEQLAYICNKGDCPMTTGYCPFVMKLEDPSCYIYNQMCIPCDYVTKEDWEYVLKPQRKEKLK